jgi:hypothetical protein
MKTTKKQLKEIAEVEKKVSKVCDAKKDNVVFDEVTGIPYVESEIKPKKTIEVTKDDSGKIINKKTGESHFKELFKNIELEKAQDGTIFNKATGEPYKNLTALLKSMVTHNKGNAVSCKDLNILLKSLTEQKEKINKVLLPSLRKETLREITVTFRFGKDEPHLGEQLEEQGFYKLSEHYIKKSEMIRQDILALNNVGILSRKQTFKCFEKLSKEISWKVVNSEKLKSEFPKHKKTILEKK